MRSRAKRVDDLEYTAGEGKQAVTLLAVDYAIDGGLVYKGQFYEDHKALLRALDISQGVVQFLGFPAEDTAAELLAQVKKKKSDWKPTVQEFSVDTPAEATAEQAQQKENEELQASLESNHFQHAAIINSFSTRPYDSAPASRQEYADRPVRGRIY